ncbi:Ubiquitin-protein ligase, putative [Hondaea fermentalgiana]|uniref:HECT-type E3 ubiquitin transferase n=1 Tax=Hondaea fermentalgiana TaxID=2315210 RepID=A0A2R5GBS4_9STRA|nr:Ubiquitin-protein ligase, putative [Hondaea fermentalgiana]|eukprot:GBG27789.1 Ubiquitin-protein ligase, putative [Hondaea fermentalgiana]
MEVDEENKTPGASASASTSSGSASSASASTTRAGDDARQKDIRLQFQRAFDGYVAKGIDRTKAAALALEDIKRGSAGAEEAADNDGDDDSNNDEEDDNKEEENTETDNGGAKEGTSGNENEQDLAKTNDDVPMADAEVEGVEQPSSPPPAPKTPSADVSSAPSSAPMETSLSTETSNAPPSTATQAIPEPADEPLLGPVFTLAELSELVEKASGVSGSATGIDALRPLIRRVGAVFSDPLHLIAAFRTGDEEPDLAMAAQVFETLAGVHDEEGLVDNALRTALRGLASQLSYPFTRSNKRRIIPSLVALEYEAFQYDPDLLTTESNLLKALTKGPSATLEHLRWFLRNKCSDEYLVRLVMQAQMYITLAATMGSESGAEVDYAYLEEGIVLLSELHDANDAAETPFIEDYTEFYNSAVNELATEDDYFLSDDLRTWLKKHFDEQQGTLTNHAQNGRKTSFCENAFMLDPGSKARLLQLEARAQQFMQGNSLRIARMRPMLPIFAIRVRRDHLVDDVLDIIARSRPEEFKRSLRVEFVGEEGVDEGGVQKEFFLLMVRQLLDPNFGMFSMDEDSRKLWFNPNTFEPSLKFELVGVILGLAIFNGVILDLTFPSAMYKKLLGVSPTLDDLKDLSPQLAKGLEDLLAFDGDVEQTFCRNFQVSYEAFGEIKTVDLVPDGANKAVTNENRAEYVRLYVDYHLNRSVEHLFRPFNKGFYLVCENTFLRVFKPAEMELLLCGNTSDKLDFADLRSSCRYEGYDADSPTISLFWEVVSEFTEEQKKRFLQFTTGSDRVPIRGLRSLQLTISKNNNANQLPTSSTCFNYLILPAYTTKDDLERKLLLAIDHAEGFGTM